MQKSKKYNDKDFSCSEYEREPAKGDFKKIAAKFEQLTVTIDEILTPGCWPGLNESRFMLEGVRANGRLKRAGSLYKLFNACNEYLGELVQAEKAIERNRKIALKMLMLLKNYEVCAVCKGECGELLGPNCWEDCCKCDGQGMIEKSL